MNTPDLVYSRDGESFGFNTIGELLDDIAGDVEPEHRLGYTYFVGEKREWQASEFFSDPAEAILDRANEHACIEAGEFADEFATKVPASAIALLEEQIKDWADKHVPVDFYTVNNVKELKLTDEDIKDMT